VYSTTDFSHFEIVYEFNPLTPIDLISLPLEKKGKFKWWKEGKDSETTSWGSSTANKKNE